MAWKRLNSNLPGGFLILRVFFLSVFWSVFALSVFCLVERGLCITLLIANPDHFQCVPPLGIAFTALNQISNQLILIQNENGH